MEKIAFFGTGLMGEPMGHRLLDAGRDLVVYNRSRGKTGTLQERGAAVAEVPAEAMEAADILITMLADYPAIREVLLDEPATDFSGKTWIQMSTIAPPESLKLKAWFEGCGGDYLEAPVLGSIPQVKEGTLFVLVGGSAAQYKRWTPLLGLFGDRLVYMGETGQAAAAKLALNQLIASLTAAFSMSLGYLREQGGDVEKFMEILRQSALYAPTFDKKLARMIRREFTRPNFPVRHLLKDVELMLREFGDSGIAVDPLDGVKNILVEAIARGAADMDYSALYNAVHPESK